MPKLKNYKLKVKLTTEGTFYVMATSLKEAKQILQETNFLDRDLTNVYFPLEYKKEIVKE